MKKFVNDPKQFVPEMLEGIALANPDTLTVRPGVQPDHARGRPARRQGLDRAGLRLRPRAGARHGRRPRACSTPPVPGDVFAAPPMDYVYETTKLLASPKGVLLLVNNYTGDRMAFDMGKEMAESEGLKVEILTINDDVAVKDSTYTVGRRGVAGNFFVIKAVGAASEQGADLDELLRIGRKVNDVTRTMGVALTACTPPAKGSPLFELGDGRDRDRRRHPRRARPRAREDQERRRDRRRAARRGRHRPAVQVRRPRSR